LLGLGRMSARWGWGLLLGVAVGCGGMPSGFPLVGERPSPAEVDPSLTPASAKGPTAQLPVPPEHWEAPALQTGLPTYELEIPQATLELFEQNVWTPEQPATFRYQGHSYPVMVRLRGASARHFPKKSWNVDFEDLRFEGREELNLVAEYQDATQMVEKLAYDWLQAAGVPAPRTRFIRLLLNGRFEGVYLDIEEVDSKFLKARSFPDRNATIYRCGSWDCELKLEPRARYQGDWKKKTNLGEGHQDLQAFLEVVNRTPEPELEATLELHFELELFLRLMAVEAIISNNYVEDSESYYVRDRVTGRWTYVPWDLNNADARWWPSYGLTMKPIVNHPLFVFSVFDPWLTRMYERRSQIYSDYQPTFCQLRTRIALNPALRARVLDRIEQAMAELLDPALSHPRIEQMYALIAPEVANDPYIDQEKFVAGRPFLRGFMSGRMEFLRQEVARVRAPLQGLVLEAVDPQQGWVEVGNRGGAPASLGGLVLTDRLRRPLSPRLPSRTLAPGERARFSKGELGLLLPQDGEVGLFDGKTVGGAIDALIYGRLGAGLRYERERAEAGRWQVR
jgi:spore coat protein H